MLLFVFDLGLPRDPQMLHALGAERYGLPCTVLRIFTCYGPRGRPDMAPLRFSRALLSGEAIEQMGDGRSWRDYVCVRAPQPAISGRRIHGAASGRQEAAAIGDAHLHFTDDDFQPRRYIDDVVSAVLAALDRPSPFAVLNVAGGKAVWIIGVGAEMTQL